MWDSHLHNLAIWPSLACQELRYQDGTFPMPWARYVSQVHKCDSINTCTPDSSSDGAYYKVYTHTILAWMDWWTYINVAALKLALCSGVEVHWRYNGVWDHVGSPQGGDSPLCYRWHWGSAQRWGNKWVQFKAVYTVMEATNHWVLHRLTYISLWNH